MSEYLVTDTELNDLVGAEARFTRAEIVDAIRKNACKKAKPERKAKPTTKPKPKPKPKVVAKPVKKKKTIRKW